MRVFAFLDIQHPAVAWAVMRGVLLSADCAPDSNSSFASFMIAGLIQHQCNWRLNNETLIEHTRRSNFPNCISRLRGMYFFESREVAQRAIDEEWGGHFKLRNLVELELYYQGQPTRVDANWITYAPRLENGRLDLSDVSWISEYWMGKPYGNRPTWELIANGEALVLTTAARALAYEVVKREFPKSWEFIEMSRIATEVGALHSGLTTPFIRRMTKNCFRLDYLFCDSSFKDASVVEKMTTHPDWSRLAEYARSNIEKDLIAPDFRPWCQEFEISAVQAGNLALAIQSVHHTS